MSLTKRRWGLGGFAEKQGEVWDREVPPGFLVKQENIHVGHIGGWTHLLKQHRHRHLYYKIDSPSWITKRTTCSSCRHAVSTIGDSNRFNTVNVTILRVISLKHS